MTRKRKQNSIRETRLQAALESFEPYNIAPFHLGKDQVESVNWEELPIALDPFYRETSKLPQARALRKRQQIESILHHALPLIEEGDTVCDFGAGAGHIALLIAFMRPACRVVIVEHNPEKHKMVYARLDHLKSQGITCKLDIYMTIDDFQRSGRPLDLGLSLHSCGLLTDETLKYCVSKRAKYVLVPCCYGQITSVVPHTSRCTSSERFSKIEQTCMAIVQSAADYTVPASDETFHESKNFQIAKRCMNIVDSDRQAWAKEQGYHTLHIGSLYPLNCSPKNNVIIGIPNSSETVAITFQKKVNSVLSDFNEFLDVDVKESMQLFASPTSSYRLRCRFGVNFDNEQDSKCLRYFIYKNGTQKIIDEFPIASIPMWELATELQTSLPNFPNLVEGIEAIHFLDTLAGDKLVTIIYSKRLDEFFWIEESDLLQQKLLSKFPSIGFIGRSKKQKLILNTKDYVSEKLVLRDGTQLMYKQYEGSFSNPNGRINERCLDWLMDASKEIITELSVSYNTVNLLELYCGCGNHTVALALQFHQIIAVELDIKLCEAAKFNAQQNNVQDQVQVLQVHSEKFCKSLLKERSYKGTDFHVVLVDPPRAGLDIDTLNSVSHFQYIIYISCNPQSLLRDLRGKLGNSHRITKFVAFDQFADTDHLEVAVCLRKR